PHSLAPTLVTLPSISRVPRAPFTKTDSPASLARFTRITASRRKVRALRTAPIFSRSSLALSVSLAPCFARSRRTKDRALRNAEKLKAERLTYEGSDRCQAY